MNGRVEEQTNGRTEEQANKQTEERMNRRTDKKANRRTDEQTSEHTEQQTNGRTDERTRLFKKLDSEWMFLKDISKGSHPFKKKVEFYEIISTAFIKSLFRFFH